MTLTSAAIIGDLPTPPPDDDLAQIAITDFDPALTPKQVEDYEADQSHVWGIKRRIALACLTKSKAELVSNVTQLDNGTDVLFELIDHAKAWMDHLQAMAELAGMAHARLCVTCATILHSSSTPE